MVGGAGMGRRGHSILSWMEGKKMSWERGYFCSFKVEIIANLEKWDYKSGIHSEEYMVTVMDIVHS